MARTKAKTGNASGNGRSAQERREEPVRALPTGYKKRSTDVVGFWNPQWDGSDDGEPPPSEIHIHFIPRSARAFDNKTDTLKNSVLIQGESVGSNTVQTGDGEVFECKDGDTIGVWYKPGMASIKDCKGVKVYMYPTGTKDTGKPQRMVMFDVTSPQTGQLMTIDDDYRKQSAHTKLPFPLAATAGEPDETDAPL